MKILNFGSLNIDLVYKMQNFVRPGETVSSLSLEKFAGGKGLNQSIALANATADVYHAGAIGTDGEFLVKMLNEKNVKTKFVKVFDENTGHAVIQVDEKGQNCIILYGGTNQKITKEQVDEVLSNFEKGDMIVLQNEINMLDYIITKAHEKEMIIALNPSPFNDIIKKLPLNMVDYFLVNEIEGTEITNETEPEKIIEKFRSEYNNCKVVLTLGKRGVITFDGTKIFKHGIYKVKPMDTTAAGDTFTGFYLALISKGYDTAEALKLASKASSIAVSIKGAANSIPTLDQVLATDLEECND